MDEVASHLIDVVVEDSERSEIRTQRTGAAPRDDDRGILQRFVADRGGDLLGASLGLEFDLIIVTLARDAAGSRFVGEKDIVEADVSTVSEQASTSTPADWVPARRWSAM